MSFKVGMILSLLASFLIPALPIQAATGNITSNLQVTIDMNYLNNGYVEAFGVMSGDVLREDGSQGSYNVPVTLFYPNDTTVCNGFGILDILNSVFYETFGFVGTTSDPNLFPLGRMFLGDEFIRNQGYVYATTQWNKLVLDRQREAGTLPNDDFNIERGTDGYLILRDLSRVLRHPSEFITGTAPTVCATSNEMAYGYSQTGMMLRQFYFSGFNTGLANSPDFDENKVFEGSIQAVPGSHCRYMTNEYPFYTYSFMNCGGETPKKQGKVITINTETDVQLINGWKARPHRNTDTNYYRVYEIAGTAHIPGSLFPLKLVELRPPEQADQNFADTGPVFRAMVEHLKNWILGTEEPPASVYLDGKVDQLQEPFFSDSSWGSNNNLVWLTKLGDDGNALGGIRLPHIRTILPNGEQAGGPIGIFRGTHCNNLPVQNDFILDCQLYGDGNIYNMVGGTVTTYKDLDSPLCETYYTDASSYHAAVESAAVFAASEGWILAEDIDSIVHGLEQTAADVYTGCVP